MYQVTLLFPSLQAFRLWCKAMGILRDNHSVNTMHHDDRLLGHYRPAPDTLDGILAEITIKKQGGSARAHAQGPVL